MSRAAQRWAETCTATHIVYVASASDGSCLYVGVTSDFDTRKSDHMAMQLWARYADRWEQIEAPNRREALALERVTIRERVPLFNVAKNSNRIDNPVGVLVARLRATASTS